MIRSDRDTVFTQPLMMAYCKERGITQQFAAVGRQDQNGLVESNVKTFKRMVRTMLADSGVPHVLWAFALNQAILIKNLLPSAALDGKRDACLAAAQLSGAEAAAKMRGGLNKPGNSHPPRGNNESIGSGRN